MNTTVLSKIGGHAGTLSFMKFAGAKRKPSMDRAVGWRILIEVDRKISLPRAQSLVEIWDCFCWVHLKPFLSVARVISN